ncbi:unnamed protein product [Linum trigynum]|uniref:F-box domain-containing protein n=1 Tax=Linum trigynum TaxID=586398 RepID=A0AAV2ELB2_9ROSI
MCSDRLSKLPESILHHILSFLDTKSAVQTSVLSRAWRSAWKHAPAIDLHSNSFKKFRKFRSFVSRVLSLRYDLNVHKVSYKYYDHDSEVSHFSLFVKVIKYALSHGTRHLAIDLGDVANDKYSYRFSDLFGSVTDSNLATLEFGYVTVDRGFGSSEFRALTTLHLDRCLLGTDQGEDIDLFPNFACLKNLVLHSCFIEGSGNYRRSFKISGPQLLSLKMLDNSLYIKIEISAPKLEFFAFWNVQAIDGLPKLSVPSLVHADIRFRCYGLSAWNIQSPMLIFIPLLQGLSNATSLVLDSSSIQALMDNIDFLEQHPSPLTRLETLILEAVTKPFRLANYLFKGSSCTYPKTELREISSESLRHCISCCYLCQ